MRELALQLPGSNTVFRGPSTLNSRFDPRTFTFGFFISDILPVVFMVMSFVAFIWIVWAAFQWIFSGGDKGAIQKAQQRITYALIGLAVMLIGFLISNVAKDVIQPRELPPAPISFSFIQKAYAQQVVCDDFDGLGGTCTNTPGCQYYVQCNKCRVAGLTPENACLVDLGNKYAFGDIQSLGQGVNRLVKPTFFIAAFAILVYFLMAGFNILRSGGDKDALGKGQRSITHAIIGFVVLMLSFLILRIFLDTLFGYNNLDPISPFSP